MFPIFPPPPSANGALKTCFIDFEASSFAGYPIELGWATSDGIYGGVLIKPSAAWLHMPWTPEAQEIHGLSKEIIAKEGRPPATALEVMRASLGSFTDYRIVSDYWALDGRWFKMLCDAAGADSRIVLAASGDGDAHAVISAALVASKTPPAVEARINRCITSFHSHCASEDAATWLAALRSIEVKNPNDVDRIFDDARLAAVAAAPWRKPVYIPLLGVA